MLISVLPLALIAIGFAFVLGRWARKKLPASKALRPGMVITALFLLIGTATYMHASWLIGFASRYGYNHPDQPIGVYPALKHFLDRTIGLGVVAMALIVALVRTSTRWAAVLLYVAPLAYCVLVLTLRASEPHVPFDLLGIVYLMGLSAVLASCGLGYASGEAPRHRDARGETSKPDP